MRSSQKTTHPRKPSVTIHPDGRAVEIAPDEVRTKILAFVLSAGRRGVYRADIKAVLTDGGVEESAAEEAIDRVIHAGEIQLGGSCYRSRLAQGRRTMAMPDLAPSIAPTHAAWLDDFSKVVGALQSLRERAVRHPTVKAGTVENTFIRHFGYIAEESLDLYRKAAQGEGNLEVVRTGSTFGRRDSADYLELRPRKLAPPAIIPTPLAKLQRAREQLHELLQTPAKPESYEAERKVFEAARADIEAACATRDYRCTTPGHRGEDVRDCELARMAERLQRLAPLDVRSKVVDLATYRRERRGAQ